MTDMTDTQNLYDGDNGEYIGVATPEQVDASNASDVKGESGLILIDADGDVVHAGSWEAQQSGVRTVFTR